MACAPGEQEGSREVDGGGWLGSGAQEIPSRICTCLNQLPETLVSKLNAFLFVSVEVQSKAVL